jgi:general secretion pathway protein K
VSRGDDGFALVPVLFAGLLLSLFAYAVLAADRGATADLQGRLRRARLEAAAEAGLATAIEALGRSGRDRWTLDGRPHAFPVEGADVVVAVEDERGKVPLTSVSPEQTRRALAYAGVSGAALDRLTDSLLNWLDGGDRPNGAKPLDYAAEGLKPRGGPPAGLDELAAIPGFTPTLLARIEPVVSFYAPAGAFDATTATPAARTIMADDDDATNQGIPAEERDDRNPALAPGGPVDYVGRPLTIRVSVKDAEGGVYDRATTVVLTGQTRRPYYVRAVDRRSCGLRRRSGPGRPRARPPPSCSASPASRWRGPDGTARRAG